MSFIFEFSDKRTYGPTQCLGSLDGRMKSVPPVDKL